MRKIKHAMIDPLGMSILIDRKNRVVKIRKAPTRTKMISTRGLKKLLEGKEVRLIGGKVNAYGTEEADVWVNLGEILQGL